MKSPNKFEEYLNKGVVKRKSPDKPRAEFLVNEAKRSKLALEKRLQKEKIGDLNSNSIIKDAYDIVMSFIRAKMLIKGYSAAGLFAHEAEVSYLRELGFKENGVQFLNQLRYYRNGILYYGKILDKEYAEKVIAFLNNVYPKLSQ